MTAILVELFPDEPKPCTRQALFGLKPQFHCTLLPGMLPNVLVSGTDASLTPRLVFQQAWE